MDSKLIFYSFKNHITLRLLTKYHFKEDNHNEGKSF